MYSCLWGCPYISIYNEPGVETAASSEHCSTDYDQKQEVWPYNYDLRGWLGVKSQPVYPHSLWTLLHGCQWGRKSSFLSHITSCCINQMTPKCIQELIPRDQVNLPVPSDRPLSVNSGFQLLTKTETRNIFLVRAFPNTAPNLWNVVRSRHSEMS